MAGRRRRGLSDEDRALWTRITGSLDRVTARATASNRSSHPPETAPESVAREMVRDREADTRALGRQAPPPPVPFGRTAHDARISIRLAGPERPQPPRPVIPGLDRNTARRLARGRRDPDAVLDLHGMTADRAHGALNRFIHDSAQAGLRCVLVVTGKGRGEDGGRRGEGVLRRETPRWLGVAPLAARIVGVFEAHPRHGGAGALYVYLKRQR